MGALPSRRAAGCDAREGCSPGRGGDARPGRWEGLRAYRLQPRRTEDAMQRVEDTTHPRVGQAVDDRLGFAAALDHAGLAQRAKLLGQPWLPDAELLFDLAHRILAFAEQAGDQQSLLVAEELQQLGHFVRAAMHTSRLGLAPSLSH